MSAVDVSLTLEQKFSININFFYCHYCFGILTELFYVTWSTPFLTQELSRLFLKYWNSSYVWNTTQNCSCLSVENTTLLLIWSFETLQAWKFTWGKVVTSCSQTDSSSLSNSSDQTNFSLETKPTGAIAWSRAAISLRFIILGLKTMAELSLAEFPF